MECGRNWKKSVTGLDKRRFRKLSIGLWWETNGTGKSWWKGERKN